MRQMYTPTRCEEDDPPSGGGAPANAGQGEFWPPDRAATSDPYGPPEPPGLGDRDLQDNRGPDAIENAGNP